MDQYSRASTIVPRPWYMSRIKKRLGYPVIKILRGMRRVGKSTLLKALIQEHVDQTGKSEHIYYLNKEFPNTFGIKNADDLYADILEYFSGTIPKGSRVCIDEVQQIEDRERTVNGLLAQYQESIEIFVTGSNATLLSSQLATLIAGRYIEFEILPLSLDEYKIFTNGKVNDRELLMQYFQYGGLPGVVRMADHTMKKDYLKGVWNTILWKDVVDHANVKNTQFLQQLYLYVMATTGSQFNASNIVKYLKSQKVSLTVQTVLQYLSYARDAHLLYELNAFEPITKKHFQIYHKWYPTDLGLRNALLGVDQTKDIGKRCEIYVYQTLHRHGWKCTIGRLRDGTEIDFIATKDGETLYIQVAYLLTDENTRIREFGNLLKLKDAYPKRVVSMDELLYGSIDGVRHARLWELESIVIPE